MESKKKNRLHACTHYEDLCIRGILFQNAWLLQMLPQKNVFGYKKKQKKRKTASKYKQMLSLVISLLRHYFFNVFLVHCLVLVFEKLQTF